MARDVFSAGAVLCHCYSLYGEILNRSNSSHLIRCGRYPSSLAVKDANFSLSILETMR